mmetsp:Transcript_70396/g.201659  ORF Transcript_70396/g.201659 Transcript_70396/m.201659 type:complete len:230 (-) Transcript_70396:54-743(-)
MGPCPNLRRRPRSRSGCPGPRPQSVPAARRRRRQRRGPGGPPRKSSRTQSVSGTSRMPNAPHRPHARRRANPPQLPSPPSAPPPCRPGAMRAQSGGAARRRRRQMGPARRGPERVSHLPRPSRTSAALQAVCRTSRGRPWSRPACKVPKRPCVRRPRLRRWCPRPASLRRSSPSRTTRRRRGPSPPCAWAAGAQARCCRGAPGKSSPTPALRSRMRSRAGGCAQSVLRP